MEQTLKTIQERKAYLKQIEAEIESVSLSANDRIRDLMFDIEQLEQEKARLMKFNMSLEQMIRENRLLSEL